MSTRLISFSLRLQGIVCGILFGLIVLGAGVRLADAGLACPDWPLCHGEVVPPFDFKIFMEWIHRVFAGSVGILALITATWIFSKRDMRSRLGFWAITSLLLFFIQAWLGGQTVIRLLRAEIVTSHLIGGYSLLFVNLVIYCLWKYPRQPSLPKFKRIVPFALQWWLVFGQAILGALVASHYAGHACPDFPLCQGQWIPEFLSPEVLLHFLHRVGATLVLLGSSLLFAVSFRGRFSKSQISMVRLGFFVVLLQWLLGISMIFTRIHPAASILHSLGSVSLFTLYSWLMIRAVVESQDQ